MTIVHILLTFIICFIFFVGIVFFLNYSRGRIRKTRHGLTGMCHQTGGTMCSTCRDTINKDTSRS